MTKLKMVAEVANLAFANSEVVAFTQPQATASAALMVDAYRGTIDWSEGDDESVALSEIEATVGSEYGPFLAPASLSLLDNNGLPIAQIAVSLFEGEATILFVYTASRFQGQGLAQKLIRASAARLLEMGYSRVSLFVTQGNPAEQLYKKLGFVAAN